MATTIGYARRHDGSCAPRRRFAISFAIWEERAAEAPVELRLYAIDVSFDAIPDRSERAYLMNLPTAFTLPAEAVKKAEIAARIAMPRRRTADQIWFCCVASGTMSRLPIPENTLRPFASLPCSLIASRRSFSESALRSASS